MATQTQNPTKKQLALLKKGLGSLYVLKCRGATDPEESLVFLDLDRYISSKGQGSLTDRQREVLQAVVFDGLTEKEAGDKLGGTQQAICYALKAALTKIYRYMKYPEHKTTGPIFDPIERQLVLDLYHEGYSYKEIAIEVGKKLKSVRNKIRNMRERGEVDVQKRLEAVQVRKSTLEQGPPGS